MLRTHEQDSFIAPPYRRVGIRRIDDVGGTRRRLRSVGRGDEEHSLSCPPSPIIAEATICSPSRPRGQHRSWEHRPPRRRLTYPRGLTYMREMSARVTVRRNCGSRALAPQHNVAPRRRHPPISPCRLRASVRPMGPSRGLHGEHRFAAMNRHRSPAPDLRRLGTGCHSRLEAELPVIHGTVDTWTCERAGALASTRWLAEMN